MSQIEQFISTTLSKYRAPHDQKETPFSRLQYVMSQLNKKGIKCHYDPPSSPDSRVLLYSSRFNKDNYELARECNGLIMDYSGKKSWTVVCRPPDLVNAQYDAAVVEKHFSSYDVYRARDGTVINLYWYNGRWCMSTARGIDMGAQNWCSVNYQKNFDALCRQYNFDTNTLDHDTTYTFGFSHPNIHIYGGKTEMWFISSYCNGKRVWSLTHETKDVKDAKDEKAPRCTLPNQEVEKITWYDVKASLEHDDEDSKTPSYGFILRSRDPWTTGINSTIYMESALMRKIRVNIYDRNLTKDAPDNVDRMRYVVLLAWLGYNAEFLSVFPRFTNDHKKMEAELTKLILEIRAGEGNTSLYKYFMGELSKYRTVADMTDSEIKRFVCTKDYASPWYQYLYPAPK